MLFAGRKVEVLVADGEGRKDEATHRMSGRARDNRLVHFAPAGAAPRPGDVVTTVVTRGAPNYLLADGPPLTVRRTRGGDAWAARRAGSRPGRLAVSRAGRTRRSRPGAAGHARARPACLTVLVAAAVCPHPPLLVPAAMGAAGDSSRDHGGSGRPGPVTSSVIMESGDDARIPELRAACAAAVAGLAAARPGLMVIVGRADRTAVYESTAAGSLRDFGVPFSTGAGPPVLPLSLTVGVWLVRRFAAVPADGTGPRPWRPPLSPPLSSPSSPSPPWQLRLQAVAADMPTADCLRLGAELAALAPRVALLAMGDASARKAAGVHGAADLAAEGYDAEVRAAFAAADPGRLARLDAALDSELMVAGRAAWQVLAGAAGAAAGDGAAAGNGRRRLPAARADPFRGRAARRHLPGRLVGELTGARTGPWLAP